MTKLSSAKAEIISRIELNPLEPASKIAKDLKMKEANVRYHIRSLQQDKVIGQIKPFIDISALGYAEYVLYCSLSVDIRSQKKLLINWLVKHNKVWWIKELVGEYQFAFSVYAKSVHEVNQLLADFNKAYGSIVNDLTFLVRTGYVLFNKQYLVAARKSKNCFSYGNEEQDPVELSDSENKVLVALVSEPYDSFRDLAKKIGIPLSTLLYLKNQLESKSIIKGYYYPIDPVHFKKSRSLLLVSIKGAPISIMDEMVDFSAKTASIVSLATCFGPWQYEIGLETSDDSEMSATIDALYQQFSQQISGLRVKPVIKLIRRS